MIPQKLTIEGLYSYQERQSIDFSNLTEAGLFGIFGAVGSGKSSILEAISFALYGETERLNSRDKRAYNMMNLKSNRSYIEFDFINHENKLFRATREYKRNSKNFEDVKPASAVFYEFKNGTWEALDHVNAEGIIGLNYSNFKRTIIIPQGQFKEFLELGAKERTDMMKEIFNLYRFDLQDKVSGLNKKNQTELDQLEGKLSGFETISEEEISAQKDNLIQAKTAQENLKLEFEKVNSHYQQLKNLKSDFELLSKKETDFSELEKNKETIDAKENQLKLYQSTFRVFNDDLKERNRNQNLLKSTEEQLKLVDENWKSLTDNSNRLQKSKEELQPKVDALPKQKILEQDLELLFHIKSDESKLAKNTESTIEGEKFVKEFKSKEEETAAKIQNQEQEISNLKTQLISSATLIEVGEWFSKKQNLTDNLVKEKTNFEANKKSIENLEEKLKKLDAEKLSTEISNLKEEKEKLQNQKNKLEVSRQLSHYSTELQDGKPCPLCGSDHHPSIAVFEDVSNDLEVLEEKLLALNGQLESLEQNAKEAEKITQEKNLISQQGKLLQNSIETIESQISELEKTFIWKDFSKDNFDQFQNRKAENQTKEFQLKTKEKELETFRTELDSIRKKLDKANQRFQEISNENLEFKTKIASNKALLKELNPSDYSEKTASEIQLQLENLKQENQNTETVWNHLISETQEIQVKLSSENTKREQFQKQVSDFNLQLEKIQNQLNENLEKSNFNDLDAVLEILNQNVDEQNIQLEIQNFKIQFETLKNSISELKEKLKDFSFDENQFLESENHFKTKESELAEANKLAIQIAAEITRLEQEFKKKEDLLKEQAALSKRAENLKTMFNLFKGAGFVQYVSSIYLRQLCDHANVRFHRMTRNQLSLQLNDNNDFEIVDFLNEGRSRSVKTLSGGQAFQVSLSLALALAESVQSNAKAEKNFFFIDEGFGTQDVESVNIVFETLMNLQKENRIVGIISHVEELKERMPISLSIEKDEERGSLIQLNS
ncbi:exonuclease SbcC [Soonwooa buanensis]|uniref:Exonuclease SbcC n=1 Tax=Soonwooa buanensis TaxID=619805 RepID=A0A1T5GRV9_9FLAO|nr:AAA family ATPase [Soonwooa buanensis]SKC11126.1 exonuclease SbcC [Soonwooa buanensis]